MSKQSGGETDREAFDRSFEFFESQDGEDDPWSVAPGPASKKMLETSFESDPFSAISSIKPEETNFNFDFLFPQDPFVSSVAPVPPLSTVRVGIHEQLSAFYDDMSTQGSVHVAGSIHVKPARGDNQVPGPFCLVCRDLLDQIDRMEARTDVCIDVTSKAKRQGLHPTDRVLRVTLPNPLIGPAAEGIAVANYVCSPGLRPVPMLVKSRVQASGDVVRVGFKVRANPSNDASLKRIMIVLAVPPNVDGQSVRMSRQGGVWDEMKRTISWSVSNLEAGEALEIQTQFTAVDAGATTTSGRNDRAPPKFPVLVRCDCSKLFSSVEVLGDFEDGFSSPIRVMPSSFSRILHRKV